MHIHMYIINPAPTTTHHSICFLSSPSLFVFSLTFFLTFSRVNNNQTNTQKKINRSVYFSFIFFPFSIFFSPNRLVSLVLSYVVTYSCKNCNKKTFACSFPLFIFPPIFNCSLCLSVCKEKD